MITTLVLHRLAVYVQHSSMKEAARVLGISESTMKNQMTRLYDQLGVSSSHQALVALGWLRIPEALYDVQSTPVCGWIGVCTRRQTEHEHFGMEATL